VRSSILLVQLVCSSVCSRRESAQGPLTEADVYPTRGYAEGDGGQRRWRGPFERCGTGYDVTHALITVREIAPAGRAGT